MGGLEHEMGKGDSSLSPVEEINPLPRIEGLNIDEYSAWFALTGWRQWEYARPMRHFPNISGLRIVLLLLLTNWMLNSPGKAEDRATLVKMIEGLEADPELKTPKDGTTNPFLVAAYYLGSIRKGDEVVRLGWFNFRAASSTEGSEPGRALLVAFQENYQIAASTRLDGGGELFVVTDNVLKAGDTVVADFTVLEADQAKQGIPVLGAQSPLPYPFKDQQELLKADGND